MTNNRQSPHRAFSPIRHGSVVASVNLPPVTSVGDDAGAVAPLSELSVLLELMRWEVNLGAVCDSNGRPLLENRSSLVRREPWRRKRVDCPYTDSRLNSHRPMNEEAMLALAPDFDGILACTDAQRRAILGGERDVMTVPEIVSLAQCFVTWPLLLWLQAPSRTEVVLPAFVANAFRAHQGLLKAARQLLVAGVEPHGAYFIADAEVLNDFIEQNKVLVGESEVCAAPPRVLARFIHVVCHGLPEDRRLTLRPALRPMPELLWSFAHVFASLEGLHTLLELKLSLTWQALLPWVKQTRPEGTAERVADSLGEVRRRQRFAPFITVPPQGLRARLVAATLALEETRIGPLIDELCAEPPAVPPTPELLIAQYTAFEAAVVRLMTPLADFWNSTWPGWASKAPTTAQLDAFYGLTPRALVGAGVR